MPPPRFCYAPLTVLFPAAALLLLLAVPPPPDCPPQGDAQDPKVQALNETRARLEEVSDSDADDTVTLEALSEPGDDESRWDDDTAVAVTGYIVEVRDGGMSSSNCHATEASDQDTILAIVPNSGTLDRAHRVFAVVTPQWRRKMAAQDVDWSTRALRATYLNRRVSLRGWLLFDFEAAPNAANTTELPGPHVDRATAWEIHPVTAIERNDDPLSGNL